MTPPRIRGYAARPARQPEGTVSRKRLQEDRTSCAVRGRDRRHPPGQCKTRQDRQDERPLGRGAVRSQHQVLVVSQVGARHSQLPDATPMRVMLG
jgi:hypothetical protein